MNVYISRNGEQHGPYSVEDLNSMLEAETLNGDDLCWYEGCETWIPLAQFPGFGTPTAPSPPPPPQGAMPLPGAATPQRAATPRGGVTPQTAPPTDSIGEQRAHPLGVIMLAIAGLGAVLIWQIDPTMGTAVAIGTVVITAILGGIEAKQLGIGSDADRTAKGKRKSGPLSWGAFIGLLWIAGFPAYLYQRGRYGSRNLLMPALVVSVLFLASPFFASPTLPAVDAPEVVAIAQRAIEESPALKLAGALVGQIRITDAGEVSYDRARQKRVARALLKTNLGSETIYYSVEWQNRSKGIIWVQIQDQERPQQPGTPTGLQENSQPAATMAAAAYLDEANLKGCISHAKQIAVACQIYAVDYNGAYPNSLNELVPDYLPEKTIFSSPLAPQPGHIDYDYFGAGGKETDPANKVLLRGRHTTKDGKRSVAYFNGSVVGGR